MDKGYKRIIFAMDVASLKEVWRWCERLDGKVGLMKIGMEAFYRFGHEVFEAPLSYGFKIMLDLKLHDIPNTVKQAAEGALNAVTKHGSLSSVEFLTVHASGGREMVGAAVEVAGPERVLGVTALTSLSSDRLEGVYKQSNAALVVADLAQEAYEGGARSFVCSPKEVKMLRSFWPDARLVVPGVRYADAGDDQKRVATPYDAIFDGASYLVVGRPIRKADAPVVACDKIAADIEQAAADREKAIREAS